MDKRALDDQFYIVRNLDRQVTLATRVAIAGTSHARRRGLLGLDKLNDGAGLWISACEAIHTFGMKIPLDVLFLDRELRVRKLVSNLSPWRIAVCVRASSVLELQHGAIASSGTEVGDRLKLEPTAKTSRTDGAQPMSSSAICLHS